ncbi:MAG: hypothetical protein KAI83_07495 [Thiomargarita sp.]|nr:hypothetical protein [Thiomargarita sp.]
MNRIALRNISKDIVVGAILYGCPESLRIFKNDNVIDQFRFILKILKF